MRFPWRKQNAFGMVDGVVLVLFIIGVYVFFYRMATILDYKWEWRVIPEYLIRFDSDTGRFVPNILLQGFIITIKLSFWSTLLALVIGIFFGIMKAKGSPGLKFVSWLYVETIRNIPSLVLVFIFYFFVSSVFLDAIGIDAWLRNCSTFVKNVVEFFLTGEARINAFVSAVITLAIYEGAYVTEIIRGGLAGISESQWEASYALGMTRFQTYIWVILPQAIRNVLSPLAGQFISTIKDSAIVSVISIQELTFQGLELMSATYLTFEVWITVALLYFILTFTMSRAAAFVEKRFALET